MVTKTLNVRGKAEEIEISLFPEKLNRDEVKERVSIFLENLDIDGVLSQVSREIIEEAYSQGDDKPQVAESEKLFQDLIIQEIECYDDDLVIFLDAQGTSLTIQLEYKSVGEIESWELDLNA